MTEGKGGVAMRRVQREGGGRDGTGKE